MPLFEFQCRACGEQCEVLVRPSTPAPTCSHCGSAELERLLSTFAIDSKATRDVALSSGRKRAALQQRDKALADREHEIHHHH